MSKFLDIRIFYLFLRFNREEAEIALSICLLTKYFIFSLLEEVNIANPHHLELKFVHMTLFDQRIKAEMACVTSR